MGLRGITAEKVPVQALGYLGAWTGLESRFRRNVCGRTNHVVLVKASLVATARSTRESCVHVVGNVERFLLLSAVPAVVAVGAV